MTTWTFRRPWTYDRQRRRRMPYPVLAEGMVVVQADGAKLLLLLRPKRVACVIGTTGTHILM